MPFVRTKRIKGILYHYLVEGYRTEDGKVRQRVLAYLGQFSTVNAAYRYWIERAKAAPDAEARQYARKIAKKLKPYL